MDIIDGLFVSEKKAGTREKNGFEYTKEEYWRIFTRENKQPLMDKRSTNWGLDAGSVGLN